MPNNCCLKIFKYSYFTENENQLMQDRQDPNYDGLWKLKQVFYILNAKFSDCIT
jgi:hypothetical protein